MKHITFPAIDLRATGRNIARLTKERGLTVRDVQSFFGFSEPQAVYKWQSGKSLSSVDNLYALSRLLEVPMEDILVPSLSDNSPHVAREQREDSRCSLFILHFAGAL